MVPKSIHKFSLVKCYLLLDSLQVWHAWHPQFSVSWPWTFLLWDLKFSWLSDVYSCKQISLLCSKQLSYAAPGRSKLASTSPVFAPLVLPYVLINIQAKRKKAKKPDPDCTHVKSVWFCLFRFSSIRPYSQSWVNPGYKKDRVCGIEVVAGYIRQGSQNFLVKCCIPYFEQNNV